MTTLVGKTLGKYRVVARLGRGGMAEVYKAYQPGLDRYVGIKVLHAHLVDDQDFIGRFEREALAIGRLRHPNIVQAVDFDRAGETYFMAMEYIDGPTLKDELKARRAEGKPLTLQETSRTFTALCSAIDYAHSRGMVHRDIKPANVMINDEGQVVLTDFGIARIMGATQYTQTGALSGTPAYMSPEQGQGERGDERSDIYSLGVMLYETVTGIVPYEADTPFAVIMKHISEPLPLPSNINPDIPEEVERVILKAMSKEPADRYQTAGEMARALRDAVGLTADDNLRMAPLVTVAPPPNIQQIEHQTGPISTMQRTQTSSDDGGATMWADAGNGATTVMASGQKSTSLMPVLIGAAVVVLLLIGVIAFLVFRSSTTQANTEATQAAVAASSASNATATAEQESLIATEQLAAGESTAAAQTVVAATAEFLAPIQTEEAATAQAERIEATEIAQATRDASLVGGILATVQAATAEAVAATAEAQVEATAVAATATAVELENATPTPLPTETPTPAPPTNTPVPALIVPTNTPIPDVPADTPTPVPPAPPALSGKLAFPADNGLAKYDVYIVSMPDGDIIGKIPGARQPNFRGDGLKLLVNGEGGSFGENVFEASGTGAIERPVSGSPMDLFPVYKPDGTTIAYSNPELATGAQGRQTYLFVQCGLVPPQQDSGQCVDIAGQGVIIPAGGIGDVIGSNPVWTGSDLLAYKGCNTWRGGGSCGMFIVGSWAVKRFSSGENPRQIVDGSSVTPTDTKLGRIAFHSRETGDFEAYIVNEDGSGVTNLSNSPTTRDGIPTISPDGRWVAFASDRGGSWAIYVVPSSGGQAQKLFDFPVANPWGTGDRDWTNERMSWGP